MRAHRDDRACVHAIGQAPALARAFDDLAFTANRDGLAEVLDFEDLEHRFRLTGSRYHGLRWEQSDHDAVAIGTGRAMEKGSRFQTTRDH